MMKNFTGNVSSPSQSGSGTIAPASIAAFSRLNSSTRAALGSTPTTGSQRNMSSFRSPPISASLIV